jgi:hypothetical protein
MLMLVDVRFLAFLLIVGPAALAVGLILML